MRVIADAIDDDLGVAVSPATVRAMIWRLGIRGRIRHPAWKYRRYRTVVDEFADVPGQMMLFGACVAR